MTDLFLEPKVLNYQEDRYELILLTLRWARALKANGTPTPMAELIEQALHDIVEGKITREEIIEHLLDPAYRGLAVVGHCGGGLARARG